MSGFSSRPSLFEDCVQSWCRVKIMQPPDVPVVKCRNKDYFCGSVGPQLLWIQHVYNKKSTLTACFVLNWLTGDELLQPYCSSVLSAH